MKNGSASERGYRILKSMKKLLLISVTNAISYFLSNQVKKKTQSKRKIYILGNTMLSCGSCVKCKHIPKYRLRTCLERHAKKCPHEIPIKGVSPA